MEQFQNKKQEQGKKRLPLPQIRPETVQLIRLWVSRVLLVISPVVNLIMVELLNQKNPFENLNSNEWSMNLLLYFSLYAVVWLILGRRRRTAAGLTGFFFLFGAVNYYVIRFRGKILFPQDILSWQTAANVADGYDFTPDEWFYGALAILIVHLLVIAFVMVPQKRREGFPKLKHIPEVAMGVASVGFLWAFFFSSWLPDAGIHTQQWKTQSNGFLYNFSLALRYSRVDAPKGYSINALEKLTQRLTEAQAEDTDLTLYTDPFTTSSQQAEAADYHSNPSKEITPTNIICIMDESFADMSIFDALAVDGDTMPFFHQLQENTIKGWMYSPVTGGGTATVEYEFLTGNSYTFLPDGTVAYDLYLKDEQPSLCSWARDLGYSTTAFHPYYSSGWNRPLVYAYMDFDDQIYTTDLEKSSKRFMRGYVSDSCDFEVLRNITETQNARGDKSFIFNVTIQNHGGYDQSWSNLERYLQVLDDDQKGKDDSTEQFIDLMRATDEALEELITYYSSIDEPTMIVLFGDHQGKLDSGVYEALYGGIDLDDRILSEVERQYVTPFCIWANYDIAEAQDVMISTNYLGALTAQVSNLPMTGYQKYLMELYKELPVINPIGIVNKDGNITARASGLSEELQQRMLEYEYLSYYSLFQRNDRVKDFFYLPKAG